MPGIAEARKRALASETDPCPNLSRTILDDMAEAALDVLIHNDGVCEANHLTAYGFTAAQIVTHHDEALRRARKAYAAQKGAPAR